MRLGRTPPVIKIREWGSLGATLSGGLANCLRDQKAKLKLRMGGMEFVYSRGDIY